MNSWQVAEQIFATLPAGPMVVSDSGQASGIRIQHPPGPWNQYHLGPIYPPDCRNCPLRYDAKVWPDGPIPARLVYIGEEPGDDEVFRGRGFIGRSGQLLWHLAKLGNVSREEVWVTNTALCKSRDVILANRAELPRNVVQAMAARACRRRLLAEILYVTQGMQHPVLQPLGNWALWSLTNLPDPKVSTYRGARIEMDLEALYASIPAATADAPQRRAR